MRGLKPASRQAALERGFPIALLAAASLWAARHPYPGIRGDSGIYIGRVLADLDPGMLGQDLMFVDDGQFRFSLFPILARPFIACFGAHTGAMLIAALACAAWFCAVLVFARAMAAGRAVWLIVAAVAFLPAAYGQTGVFAFAETGALPRPFAEALVLLALAMLLKGAPWRAAGFLGLAVCLHPLMALAGIAVFLFFQALDPSSVRVAIRKVGTIPAGLAGAAVLAVVLAGLAATGRLAEPDPDWIAILRIHSPFLFPAMWSTSAFALLLTQSVTLVVAAHCASPPVRGLFLAILISGSVGLAVAVLAGDVWPILIVVQGQPWRIVWIAGAAGAAALGLCAKPLWTGGGQGRTVLALLLLGWNAETDLALATIASGAALFIHVAPFGKRLNSAQALQRIAGAMVAALAILAVAGPFLAPAIYLMNPSHAIPPDVAGFLRRNLLSAPLCLAALAVIFAPPKNRTLAAAALTPATLLVAAAAAFSWDQHAPGVAFLERPAFVTEFQAMAAGRPKEILWVDGQFQAWYTLGRPQYLAEPQSFGIVFSRQLAGEWIRRARVAIEAGLARPRIIARWSPPSGKEPSLLPENNAETANKISAFCGRPDAPGVIALPLKAGAPPYALPGMIQWRLPRHVFAPERDHAGEWAEIEGYGFVPCAPRRAGGESPEAVTAQ